MDEVEDDEFPKHTVVGIQSPDGKLSAEEMIIGRLPNGELDIRPVPGARKTLPLTREQAARWLDSLKSSLPEESKAEKMKMLCGEE